MRKTGALIAIAFAFWFVLFSPWTKPHIPFWPIMTTATGVLALSTLLINRKELKSTYYFRYLHIAIGLAATLLLYIIFFAGNLIAELVFPFASQQVQNVYSIKTQISTPVIIPLLLFWIGPAEEIIWRGFVQHNLSECIGPSKGFIIASLIYTLVHIWSFNFMLIIASLVCGLFWGFLYYKYKSLWPSIICHAVWDVLIFVILPIQ